jgi:hypothetical protein
MLAESIECYLLWIDTFGLLLEENLMNNYDPKVGVKERGSQLKKRRKAKKPLRLVIFQVKRWRMDF